MTQQEQYLDISVQMNEFQQDLNFLLQQEDTRDHFYEIFALRAEIERLRMAKEKLGLEIGVERFEMRVR